MKKLIAFIKYLLIFLLALIIGLKGYNYLLLGLDNTISNTVTYTIKPNIEYKVHLKDNNFFDESYLGMNRTYISSLIDYIDITYNYTVDFDTYVKGNYNYYIKGTISADKEDENGNYWEKDFIIKNNEYVEFKNNNKVNINTSVRIDYQKYNDMLKEFKKQYGIDFEGKFNIEQNIVLICDSENLNNPFIIESFPTLTIPLTEQTIDLSIDTNTKEEVKTVEEKVKDPNSNNKIYMFLGIILELVTLCLLITLYVSIMNKRFMQSKYTRALKKILSTYDGIIVNLKTMPNLGDSNIVFVEEFSELIDAHNEVRLPINYYEKDEYISLFALRGNGMTWVFILYDKDKIKLDKKAIKEKLKDNYM